MPLNSTELIWCLSPAVQVTLTPQSVGEGDTSWLFFLPNRAQGAPVMMKCPSLPALTPERQMKPPQKTLGFMAPTNCILQAGTRLQTQVPPAFIGHRRSVPVGLSPWGSKGCSKLLIPSAHDQEGTEMGDINHAGEGLHLTSHCGCFHRHGHCPHPHLHALFSLEEIQSEALPASSLPAVLRLMPEWKGGVLCLWHCGLICLPAPSPP